MARAYPWPGARYADTSMAQHRPKEELLRAASARQDGVAAKIGGAVHRDF